MLFNSVFRTHSDICPPGPPLKLANYDGFKQYDAGQANAFPWTPSQAQQYRHVELVCLEFCQQDGKKYVLRMPLPVPMTGQKLSLLARHIAGIVLAPILTASDSAWPRESHPLQTWSSQNLGRQIQGLKAVIMAPQHWHVASTYDHMFLSFSHGRMTTQRSASP